MTPVGMKLLTKRPELSVNGHCMVLLAAMALISISGCTGPEKAAGAPSPEFCVIRQADHKCWLEQEQGKGIDLKDIEGFFAISPDDLDEIAFRLNQCHDTGASK